MPEVIMAIYLDMQGMEKIPQHPALCIVDIKNYTVPHRIKADIKVNILGHLGFAVYSFIYVNYNKCINIKT